jgi:hypothetical protein
MDGIIGYFPLPGSVEPELRNGVVHDDTDTEQLRRLG